MKKQNLKTLKLNKKSISNFNTVVGGKKTTVEPPSTPFLTLQTYEQVCYTMLDESMCWE